MLAAVPSAVRALERGAHDALFRGIHRNTLIYNACWEDPRIDRELLGIGPASRIAMITSAGCNALDYLLDGPAEIHAVDLNPRQNAVLQLKIALIQHGDYTELFRVFGHGVRPGFRGLLESLAGRLGQYARGFWWNNHAYFEQTRLSPSFYYRGAAGRAARMLLHVLFRGSPDVRRLAGRLLDASDLSEQRALYRYLRPVLWTSSSRCLVRNPVTLALMGVPRSQSALIEASFPGGVAGYLQSKIEHVFTRVPMKDNYFWRVYAAGGYTRECCPNYLRLENLHTLRHRVAGIHTHTSSFSEFLEANPGPYSHFVLLDHQDWMASHDPVALRREWDLILASSRPGSRILMRSASPEIDFIPPKVRERLKLSPGIGDRLQDRDRVGTYGSTLLAEVQ